MVRPCGNHAAYFPIRVSSGLLAVPRQDMSFEGSPLFFCLFGGGLSYMTKRLETEGVVAGMGLFSDKCEAIVDVATGRALSGEDLKTAEKLLSAVDHDGRVARLSGASVVNVLAEKGWGFCGNKVPKRAHVCSKCGTRAPGGWIKCPECDNWVGNESHFCPHCNHRMHPEERIDLAGGVWDREPGLFAQRFECGDLSHLSRSGLYVQEGSRAILMDGGREVKTLGPGRHTPESLARSVNWFGNPPPRSVVMVDSGDNILRLDFGSAKDVQQPVDEEQSSLRSAEEKPLRVVAEATLRFDPSGADDFLANLMKDSRKIPFGDIAQLMYEEALPAVKTLCAQTTIEDLVKDPERRERFEDAIDKAVRPLLKRNGIELVRIGAVDVISADYEDLRRKYGEFDRKRRDVEFDRKMLDVLAQEDVQKREDFAARDERAQESERARRKRWQETQEYIAQLAADKQIGEIERDNAVEIAKRVAKGELDRKDAELERALRIEQYARGLEDQAHTLKLDLNLKNYNREQLLADAANKAKLAEIAREERVKEAKTDTLVMGEKVDEAKYEAEIKRIKSDAQKYEDMNDLDVLERKFKIDNSSLGERAKILAGKSPLEMMALAKTDAERQGYLTLALNAQKAEAEKDVIGVKKDMSPEQLLALAAQQNPTAAQALAAMAAAGNNAAERVVKELKEQLDKRETHDNALMEQVVKIVTESVKHQSTVVQAPPANQVFQK